MEFAGQDGLEVSPRNPSHMHVKLRPGNVWSFRCGLVSLPLVNGQVLTEYMQVVLTFLLRPVPHSKLKLGLVPFLATRRER